MMQMFEVAATLFDSILAIWFVTKFCKLETKRRYQIGAVLLLLCVTVFCDKYLSAFNIIGILALAGLTIFYSALAAYRISFRQILASCLFCVSLIAVSSTMIILINFKKEIIAGGKCSSGKWMACKHDRS